MAVDGPDVAAEGLELGRQRLGGLLGRDVVALALAVAVEDGHDVGELVVDDEVQRLPDLAFAALAVADDAVDSLVGARRAGRPRPGRRRRESPWPSEPVAASKNGKPIGGVGVAVEDAVGLAERQGVVEAQLATGCSACRRPRRGRSRRRR